MGEHKRDNVYCLDRPCVLVIGGLTQRELATYLGTVSEHDVGEAQPQTASCLG